VVAPECGPASDEVGFGQFYDLSLVELAHGCVQDLLPVVRVRDLGGLVLFSSFEETELRQDLWTTAARNRETAMPRKSPDPIDILVGRNIRIQRLKRAMSQEKLADALGLTFQQVQKYEKGTNRIGSGRLHKIAAIFNIPIASLFEGADLKAGAVESSLGMLAEPQVLRMVQALSIIKDVTMRHSLVDLVERIAATYPAGGVKRRSGAGRTSS
jgi:transcriptional regulator with XRE-family HTH domain